MCESKEVAGENFPVCFVGGEKPFKCVESECMNFICYTGKIEAALRDW